MVWSNQAPTSLVFPPGATTGVRLVINAQGITVYDADNNPVLEIFSSSYQYGINFPYDAAFPPSGGTPGSIQWADIPGTFAAGFQWLLDNIVGQNYDSDQLSLLTEDGFGAGHQAILVTKQGLVTIPNLNVGGATSPNKGTFQMGAGYKGSYYYEEATSVGGVIAANAWTNPTWTSSLLKSDYGATAFLNDTWTAPDTGIYHICIQHAGTVAQAVGTRQIARITSAAGGLGTTYANVESGIANNGRIGLCLNSLHEWGAGTVLHFDVFNAGVVDTFLAPTSAVVRRML